MKKLGEIVVKTRDGLLIVKSKLRDPRKLVGSLVYDSSLKRIGRIVDVIGRIDQPYIVVKPEDKSIIDYVSYGPVYYYVEKKKMFRGKVRGKRKSRRGRGRRRKKP